MSWSRQIGYRVGRLTERLPAPAHAALWRTLRLGRSAELVRLSGPTLAGTPGTMIVAGFAQNDFVGRKFFAGEPHAESLGRVAVWRLAARLRPLAARANLTVALLDRVLVRLLPHREFLPVPEWVCLACDPVRNVREAPHVSQSVRRDARQMRSQGFTCVVSHDVDEARVFFAEMLLPHVSARHPDPLCSLAAVQESLKRGVLLWTVQEGRRVAGIVVEQHGDVFRFRHIGVLHGDAALLKRGVLAAAYIHAIEYVSQHGCRLVDLGGCRPWLSDGVLRYKLKWRPRLHSRRLTSNDALLRWPAGDPAVAAMLRAHPLICRRGDEFSFLLGDSAWPPQPLPAVPGEWPALPAAPAHQGSA